MKIISCFHEKAKTRIAWWGMGLGLPVLFSGPILGASAAVIVPFIRRTFNEQTSSTIGLSLAIILFVLDITGLILSLRAFFYRRAVLGYVTWAYNSVISSPVLANYDYRRINFSTLICLTALFNFYLRSKKS